MALLLETVARALRWPLSRYMTMIIIVSSDYEKESYKVMENPTHPETLCPVARAEAIVGDR